MDLTAYRATNGTNGREYERGFITTLGVIRGRCPLCKKGDMNEAEGRDQRCWSVADIER